MSGAGTKPAPGTLGTAASVPREPAIYSGPDGRWRVDLLRLWPWLKWLLTRRWFQFAVVLPNLVIFYFFLIAGLWGSPVGNRNIIIIFVWILWWFLLIAAMVPFTSRVWCTVCPFPFFGEWYQRRALIGVRVGKPGVGKNRMWGLNRKWPKALANIWTQNLGFLALCTFSALLLTRPIVSVVVLGGLIVVATVLHVVYRQRAFCNYVCPVSGFLSLFSMTSMLEVRSRSEEVCKKCTDKGCLAGGEQGWGCPWFMYPSKMDRNNYCGLCMECLKTCPHDNMTLRLRPFATDSRIKGYDESWKAFIMMALCLAYSVTLLGPWGLVKDWANAPETGQWAGFAAYAAILWAFALVVLPAVFWLAVRAGRGLGGPTQASPKDLFLGYSYVLVPLGLLAWIAFSFPLIFINGAYILSVASDPLGRGWDLLGTAHFPWTPLVPHWMPHIQVAMLLLGLYYALREGYRFAACHYVAGLPAARAFAPVALLVTGLTGVFMRLYAG